MFGAIKDSLTSTAAKSLLGARIERYGRLTDLRIRSKDRTIDAELVLAGETAPVQLRVEKYRIEVQPGGGHAVVVERVSCSREWLQYLLEDFLVEKPMAIPSVALLALGGP